MLILLAILSFDAAAGFHGDVSLDAAAVVALVVGIVSVLLELRGRSVL